MSLEKSNMPLSVKQISAMDTNHKFNFDHIVQRGLVWERSRKTSLIESLILGYPVPQIFCRRDRDENAPKKKGNSTYVIMDGKQRITTVSSFYRGEWALTNVAPITYTTYTDEEETIDISGKIFEELPEELQDAIKDTMFNFICFENITPQEERELFKRLNSGKPLSTKAKVVANCKDIENILEIGKHQLFTEMLTENALNQKNHVAIIMKIWTMMYKDINDISFESKYFNPQVEETIIEPDQSTALLDVFDYIQQVHDYIVSTDTTREIKKIAKKFYTETHVVSLVPFIQIAIAEDIPVDIFGDWVIQFFKYDAEDPEYVGATSRGSAKNENIQIRHNVMKTSWNNYFIR